MSFITELYRGNELEQWANLVHRNYLYIPDYGISTELGTIRRLLENNAPIDELEPWIGIIGFIDDEPIVNCLFTKDGWFSIYTKPNYRFKGYAKQLINIHKDLMEECKVKPQPHSTEGLRLFGKVFKSFEPTCEVNTKCNRLVRSAPTIEFTDYVHQLLDTNKQSYLKDTLDSGVVSAVFIQCVMDVNIWFNEKAVHRILEYNETKKLVAMVLSDIQLHLSFKCNGELTPKQFDSYLNECMSCYLDCYLNTFKVTYKGNPIMYLHK